MSLFEIPYSVFDIPIIGSHIGKIGRAIDIWQQPCSSPPEVWAKAFFQAIPTALVSIAKPELVDIGIPGKHQKSKKGVRGKFRAAWQLTDNIVTVPVPQWRIFRAFELSEFVGFWLMIADITEDFAINWMSLAYEIQGCDPGDIYAYGSAGSNVILIGQDHLATIGVWNFPQGSWKNCNPQYWRINVLADQDLRVSAGLDIRPHPVGSPPGMPLSTRIVDRVGGRVIAQSPDGAGPDGALHGRAAGFDKPKKDAQYIVQCIGTPGHCLLDGGTFHCTSAAGKNLGVDP